MTKAQFTLPELHDDKLLEWNVHVTKDPGNCDMIIGRDILSFLKINHRFSTVDVEWEQAVMPFKHVNATPLDAHFIKDPTKAEEDAHDRIKKILDAKYEPANLDKVCSTQSHLVVEQQQKLLDLLNKHGRPI